MDIWLFSTICFSVPSLKLFARLHLLIILEVPSDSTTYYSNSFHFFFSQVFLFCYEPRSCVCYFAFHPYVFAFGLKMESIYSLSTGTPSPVFPSGIHSAANQSIASLTSDSSNSLMRRIPTSITAFFCAATLYSSKLTLLSRTLSLSFSFSFFFPFSLLLAVLLSLPLYPL